MSFFLFFVFLFVRSFVCLFVCLFVSRQGRKSESKIRQEMAEEKHDLLRSQRTRTCTISAKPSDDSFRMHSPLRDVCVCVLSDFPSRAEQISRLQQALEHRDKKVQRFAFVATASSSGHTFLFGFC